MKQQQGHSPPHEHLEPVLLEEEEEEYYIPIEERYTPIEDRTTDRRLVLWRPPQVWEEWAHLSERKMQR